MKTNLRHVPKLISPRWCVNGHTHTIGRSLVGDTSHPSLEHIEILTPDNDFLELGCAIKEDSKAIIVLFHGMEGSTNRYYMVEAMKRLIANDYSVVGVNFRSCGSKMNNRPQFYHAGETEDLKTVFRWIQDNYPDQKIGAAGFSLGANILTKYLAEERETTPVEIAVAVSVPYDLRLTSILLTKGFRRVYNYYLLRSLRKKLEIKRNQFSDLPSFSGSTIYEFDDQITAKIHGFDSAEDYYQKCSAQGFVENIRTHTLFVHSRDDPFLPIEAMPIAKINQNDFTDYIITEEGGHVGFWSRPKGWLNFVIENYFSSNI